MNLLSNSHMLRLENTNMHLHLEEVQKSVGMGIQRDLGPVKIVEKILLIINATNLRHLFDFMCLHGPVKIPHKLQTYLKQDKNRFYFCVLLTEFYMVFYDTGPRHSPGFLVSFIYFYVCFAGRVNGWCC